MVDHVRDENREVASGSNYPHLPASLGDRSATGDDRAQPACATEPGLETGSGFEEWRPVVGFEGAYDVSSLGRVRSVRTGRIINPAPINELGHLQVKLWVGGKQHGRLVHRLVLDAFKGPCPVGMESRHVVDRDPGNNASANLAWGTSSENERDKVLHGTVAVGARTWRRYWKWAASLPPLTGSELDVIREQMAAPDSPFSLALGGAR